MMKIAGKLTLMVLLALSVAVFPACKSGGAGQTKDDGAEGAGKAKVPAPPSGFEAASPAESRALERLPADTLFSVYADEPLELANRMGRKQVIDTLGEPYQRLKKQMRSMTGHDLLAPEGLREAGVDPNGSAGLFWLDLQHEVGGGFVALNDAETFVSTVREITEEGPGSVKLNVAEVGDAKVLHPKGQGDEVTILVGADHAFLIISDDRDEAPARNVARRLAERADGEGLGSHPGFRKARRGLRFGDDVTGFLNVQTILKGMRARIEGEPNSGYMKHMQERLKSAREAGDEKEVAKYEQRIEQLEARMKESRQRREDFLAIAEELWGDIPGIGFGMQVDGAAVRTKAYLPSADGSILSELVGATDAPHALLGALSEPPLFAGSSRISTDTAVSLFERVLEVGGGAEQYAAWKQRVAEAYGVDLDTEVFDRLTGEFGFYLDGPMETLFGGGGDAIRQTTGGLVVGVEEAGKIDAMIADLIDRFGMSRFIKRQSGDSETDEESDAAKPKGPWRVSLPMGKAVQLEVSDGYLTVSTESDFHGLVTGNAEPETSLLDAPDEGPVALLGAEGAAAVGHTQIGLMGTGLMQYSGGGVGYASKQIVEHHSDRPEPDTPEFEKTKKELRELNERLDELNEKEDEAERTMARRWVELLGETSFAVRPEADGLAVYVGKFVGADSVSAAVVQAADAWSEYAGVEREVSARKRELWDRRRQLRDELEQMRREAAREEAKEEQAK